MSSYQLKKHFFARPTAQVAKDLVGAYLVRKFSEEQIIGKQITETEGYLGEKDNACHARRGKTERTKVMYQDPSTMYVYLIYGMYDMLNIVTEKEGVPEAVLIRGAGELDGPGKLTRELDITKEKHNGKQLGREAGVWIEKRPDDFDADQIKTTSRIGIDYADKEWREKKLRFVLD